MSDFVLNESESLHHSIFWGEGELGGGHAATRDGIQNQNAVCSSPGPPVRLRARYQVF